MLRTSRVRARPALRRAAQESATIDEVHSTNGESESIAKPGKSASSAANTAAGASRCPSAATCVPRPTACARRCSTGSASRSTAWRCLDLFAGSGALGFEAASRGAARVVMVENDRAVFRTPRENARELIGDKAGRARARATRSSISQRSGERFDVVFLDPPFRQNALPALLERLPPRLAPGARVYVEAAEPARAGRGLARAQARARRTGELPALRMERR